MAGFRLFSAVGLRDDRSLVHKATSSPAHLQDLTSGASHAPYAPGHPMVATLRLLMGIQGAISLEFKTGPHFT